MEHKMKKMCMRVFLIMLLGIFSINTLSAQGGSSITVKGNVKDKQGEAVIGASVIVSGTTAGTITDIEGNYSVTATSNGTLEIKYLGYKTQIIPVQSRSTINVILEEDSELLGEVVVIGYGTVKKEDATGSVTAIKIDDMNKNFSSSPQDLLTGKIPGVAVTLGDGAPGSAATIRIRGGASLSASNDPLIVIDGVIMSDKTVGGLANGLSTLNPNDIETFTVLKDASAAAIYGSRGSNGVIIITTKKGTAGKLKIAYNGNVSIKTKRNSLDVLSGNEYRDFITNMPGVSSAALDALNLYPEQSTDWQDEVFRTSVSTEHNLSFMGTAKEILPYRVSLGYTNENGILKTSNFERFSGGIVLTPSLFDDHLKVTLNAKGSYINNRFADSGAVGAAVSYDPTKPVHNDSKYGGFYEWTTGGDKDAELIGSSGKNPLGLLDMRLDKSKVKTFLGSAQFDYKLHFFPDLRVNVNLSYDYSNSDGTNYQYPNSANVWGVDVDKSGRRAEFENTYINRLFESYGQYVKEVESIYSKFDVMAGYSYQSYKQDVDNVTYYLSRDPDRFAQITEPVNPATWDGKKYVLISFYGRFNYTLMDRYLLTFTIRDDESSRLQKGNRNEWFPSLGLGWKINEESFMKDITAINNLKLRLGWGKTGQQNTSDNWYPSQQGWLPGDGGAMYPVYDESGNVQWVNVIKPIHVNPDLKWEITTTWNAALDYGFLNNRINGSLDVYTRKTKRLINEEVYLAAGTGFGVKTIANIGSLTNKGIEFSINATPIQTRDFSWDLGYNIAYNKSEIDQLTFNDAMSSSTGTRFASTGGDGAKTIKIHSAGYSPGAWYVYEQIYDENGKPIEGAYVDRNKDGVINDDDLRQYKKPDADVIMGFSSKFIYKKWDLGFNGRVSLGNYNYNAVAANDADASLNGVFSNTHLKNKLRVSVDNGFQSRQRLSDYYIQNASFLKIDNITLGYSFDAYKNKINGRVFGSVQNPIVITKYDGLDPEVFGGIDSNMYPRALSFILGLSLNF